jgi:hypothetical protein
MVIGRLIAGREGDFWGYGEFNFELFDLRLSYVQALASEDWERLQMASIYLPQWNMPLCTKYRGRGQKSCNQPG